MTDQSNKLQNIKSRVVGAKEQFKDTLERFTHTHEHELESFLRENAIYSERDYKEADITTVIKNFQLTKIGMGLLGRIYKLDKTNWVMKEGRWDLSIEMFGNVRLKLPARLLQTIFKLAKYQFLPEKEEILKQYEDYLIFTRYFGFFEDENTYYHPNKDFIFSAQKTLRDTLLLFKEEIENKYGLKFNGKLEELLSSKTIKYHNFLPKEYLLIGKSISKENKGKITFLIFQEFITGRILHKLTHTGLDVDSKKQMILMIYLMLLMHMQTGKIPDTRPKYPFIEAYNWLTKTDNIIVSQKRGLVFIDTRWLWDSTTSNLIQRGVFIPPLFIKNCKGILTNLLNQV